MRGGRSNAHQLREQKAASAAALRASFSPRSCAAAAALQ